MGSERITLQLYLEEIVTLISEGITASSWASKRKVCASSLHRTPSSFPFLLPLVLFLLITQSAMLLRLSSNLHHILVVPCHVNMGVGVGVDLGVTYL